MAQRDEALVDELVRLERVPDLALALRLLVSRALPAEALTATATSLYQQGMTAIPFMIADQLLRAGKEHWVLHALAAHLGLRLGREEAAAASAARLGSLLAAASQAERASARALMVAAVASEAISAFQGGRKPLLRALARLWAAVEPQTMARLAPPPPGHRPDLGRFRDPPDAGHVLSFAAPPAGTPRVERTAVLAIRRLWFPHQPNSREHEVPVRIAAAMEAYGWRAARYHIRSFFHRQTVVADYLAIAELCRAADADLVILDEFQPSRDGNTAPGEILRALKRERPGLRMVGLYLDPWDPKQWDDIAAGADILDGFWSPVITALWQRPAFRGKILSFPMPHGGFYAAQGPLRPELCFLGGVQNANWYRAFWLAAIADAGLPLRVALSAHEQDGLSPLDSYRAYMGRTGAAGAVLNFALRSNGARTLTARTFEVPASGGLLVQERSPDIDSFFVAGRHYLGFETLADLADIGFLLRAAPDRAESIRRAGIDFFQERYADAKLIGYLDHFLFQRPP